MSYSSGMPGMGGGGMDMMGMFYPQLLGPMRQMAYGQVLLGQGAEMTPLRSPWQAIARAAAGALGGYETGAGLQAAQGAQQEMQARSDAAVREALGGPLPGQQQAPTAQPQPSAQPGAQPQPSAQPQAKPAGKMVAEPTNLSGTYDTAAASSGIPRNILVAKDSVESGFNNDAVSSTGAAGVPQILASTADNPGFGMTPLGTENHTNPDRAIPFGANYLAARGKALFGNQWDPTNSAQMHAALKAYGDGTDAYADKVMAASGAPAVPPVIAAVSNSTLGAPPVQGGMAQSQELAVRYERAAMALSGSMNPQDRMRAQMFLSQAQFYRQQGAWTDPAEIQPGIFAQRNTFTGETKIQGRATPVEKDANGNLVRTSDGSIVSATNGWRPTGRVSQDGRSTEIIGPDGKPEWIAPQQITAETQQQDDYRTLTSLSDKMQNNTATAEERAKFGGAYTRLGGMGELKDMGPNLGMQLVGSTRMPPNVYRIPGTPGGTGPAAQAPGAPAAAAAPGGPTAPAAVPTVQVGPSAQAAAAQRTTYEGRVAGDRKQVGDEMTAADSTRDIYGTTSAIRDLLATTRTGWTAEARAHGAAILTGLGADQATAQNWFGTTDLSDTQALDKLFLQQTMKAVRSGLGAREPGAVVQTAVSKFPSLATMSGATDLMSRLMDLDQRFKEDRAYARSSWLDQQQANAEGAGGLGSYKGLSGFQQSWDRAAENRPETYIGAAMLAAGRPYATWGAGLSKDQQVAAAKLAAQQYPAQFQARGQQVGQ